MIQRFEYAAFGRESFALNPNLSWDPAFTGQQYDIETGLYYYRARYYNPILGRFTQPDTIVQNTTDPQSWNRYAYVRNNPLKYVDPSGNVIEIDLNDSEHSVAEDAASLDWSGSPSFDSASDIPDGTYGEVTIGGTDAFVDFTGGGGSPSSDSSSGSGGVSNEGGGGYADRGVSVSSSREEGGLVGAAVSQTGILTTNSIFSASNISNTLSMTRAVNEAAGLVGLGVLLFAPHVGAAILSTTLIAGLTIDITDLAFGQMTARQFTTSFLSTIIGKVAGGPIASKLGIKYGFHTSISRYFSTSSGRFVSAPAGRAGNFIEKLIGKDIKALSKWGLENSGENE